MMQELDDRLKEQIDKLEHIRLAAVELRDNFSGVTWLESSSTVNKPSLYSDIVDFLEAYCDFFFLIQTTSDLTQSISDHLEWLNHLSERVETLHVNTSVFIQVGNAKKLLQ